MNHNLTSVYRLIIPAVSALSLLAGCHTGANLQPTSTPLSGFDAADANHDGKLSRDEASDFLVERVFDARDANHDGGLTLQEAGGSSRATLADFKRRDTNHDGVVTKEEAVKYGRAHGIVNKMMREADKNGDGFLDRQEVQEYYASREGPAR
jgi:Ca2+-binding EF-hand superfamily protein